MLALTLVLASGVLLFSSVCFGADADRILSSSRWVISGEGTVAHFGPRLNDRAIQAWNLSARFSLLPFGVWRSGFLDGTLDGALEVGLEPTFERFSVRHQKSSPAARFGVQYNSCRVIGAIACTPPVSSDHSGYANFGGVGLVLRYYLVHFEYGPLVPWIEAGIAPGGTDLKIGNESNETRLTGTFMNRVKGGVGVSYFISEQADAYLGLQAQHLSNAGLNGPNRNYALNTPVSFTMGLSWFVH